MNVLLDISELLLALISVNSKVCLFPCKPGKHSGHCVPAQRF